MSDPLIWTAYGKRGLFLAMTEPEDGLTPGYARFGSDQKMYRITIHYASATVFLGHPVDLSPAAVGRLVNGRAW